MSMLLPSMAVSGHTEMNVVRFDDGREVGDAGCNAG